MPRNGTGTYSLPQPPFVAGTVISSAAMNSDLSDIASALTGSLPRDGQVGMTGALLAANGSSVAPSITFGNDEQSGFFLPSAGVIGIVISGTQIGTFSATGGSFSLDSGVPVGTVVDFAGPTTPNLWHLCFGQNASRTAFAALFTAIGTTYGSGDGVTTFGLPDYRGITGVGKDNMGGTGANRLTSTFFGANATLLGAIGGSQDRSLSSANLPAYTPAGTVASSMSPQVINPSSLVSFNGGGSFETVVGNAIITATVSSTFTGTAAAGQINTPIATVQPSIVVNKIIYAGA